MCMLAKRRDSYKVTIVYQYHMGGNLCIIVNDAARCCSVRFTAVASAAQFEDVTYWIVISGHFGASS